MYFSFNRIHHIYRCQNRTHERKARRQLLQRFRCHLKSTHLHAFLPLEEWREKKREGLPLAVVRMRSVVDASRGDGVDIDLASVASAVTRLEPEDGNQLESVDETLLRGDG